MAGLLLWLCVMVCFPLLLLLRYLDHTRVLLQAAGRAVARGLGPRPEARVATPT